MAVHGRFTVTVNGRQFQTESGATFDPGGVTRESVSGDQGYVGKRVTATRPARLTGNVIFQSGDSLSDYDFDGAVATIESDAGQAWVVSDAGTVDTRELGTSLSLTIEGRPAQEMI